MSLLERVAVVLSSGRTSLGAQEALDALSEVTALARALIAVRDANCQQCYPVAAKIWEKVSRRVIYRAGYRLSGNTQRRLARDSIKAWCLAQCPRCKGARIDCDFCSRTGVVLPEDWSSGEALELMKTALSALDSRYSTGVVELYRANRAAEVSNSPEGQRR